MTTHKSHNNKINFFAIRNTIDSVLKNKIKKLIFISTCSNYGLIEHKKLASENHKLDPKSLYAKQKVLAEKYILQFKKKTDTTVTILRFATAFGVSKRMRFDLTVNEFDQYISIDDSLGDKEKKEIIKVADVNADGEIDFAEFAKFLDHDGN